MASSVYKQPEWFPFILLWLIIFNLVTSAFSLHQVDPCKCTLKNNSVVDLSPLSRSDAKPVFTGVLDEEDGLYEYSPCQDFSDPSSDKCKNVAICRKNITESSYTALGNHINVTFEVDLESSQLYLLYQQYINGQTLKSYVFLICTPHSTLSNLTAEYISPTSYHFHLFSPWACPAAVHKVHTLSTGSILCITFLSLVLGYFCTGMMYRRVVHEASGVAMLPHSTFWTELPGLIRDGYLFFISPCLGNNVRYQAYRYEPL